jgi:hypothetical protein
MSMYPPADSCCWLSLGSFCRLHLSSLSWVLSGFRPENVFPYQAVGSSIPAASFPTRWAMFSLRAVAVFGALGLGCWG